MKKSLVLLLLVILFLASGCITESSVINPPEKDKILVYIYVLKDEPEYKSTYKLMNGTPIEVGVYKFYLEHADLPGTGIFEKVDVITLKKISDNEYYGKKYIKEINETLCIGYPSMNHPVFGNQNFIDGKAVVEIYENSKEVNMTVYFWETWLRID